MASPVQLRLAPRFNGFAGSIEVCALAEGGLNGLGCVGYVVFGVNH